MTTRKGAFVQTHDDVLPLINGQLGEKNLGKQSLGVGGGGHLDLAGAHNAQWSVVNLSGVSDLSNVPVQHALGVVPVSCEFVDVENSATPGTFVAVRPVNRSSWTATECRVAVNLIAGSATGALVRFRVYGA